MKGEVVPVEDFLARAAKLSGVSEETTVVLLDACGPAPVSCGCAQCMGGAGVQPAAFDWGAQGRMHSTGILRTCGQEQC